MAKLSSIGASRFRSITRCVLLTGTAIGGCGVLMIAGALAQANLPSNSAETPSPDSRNVEQRQEPGTTLLPPVVVRAPTRRPPRAKQPTQARPAANRLPAPATTPATFRVPSTAMIGPSAPPFAGGQVATASSLGFLGNRGIFDAPFNVTSYTSKTIEDQQARSLSDVMSNSPSVRAPSASDGVFDNFMIRGFPVTAAAFTMEGLYGVLPAQMVAIEFISRLELLTGPSAFLNSATRFRTGWRNDQHCA